MVSFIEDTLGSFTSNGRCQDLVSCDMLSHTLCLRPWCDYVYSFSVFLWDSSLDLTNRMYYLTVASGGVVRIFLPNTRTRMIMRSEGQNNLLMARWLFAQHFAAQVFADV